MWSPLTKASVLAAAQQSLATIEDVIKTQKDVGIALAGLDAASGSNPVRAFNDLYIQVTEAVKDGIGTPGHFIDSAFMEILDIEFARLYFQALIDWCSGLPVPGPWEDLFLLKRGGQRLSDLEGALLGVHAHINHDLTIAIVNAVAAAPAGSMVDRRRDFDLINNIFVAKMDPITKTLVEQLDDDFLKSMLNLLDFLFGESDEDMTMWIIIEMRNQAWERAENILLLEGSPTAGFWGDAASFLAEFFISTDEFQTERADELSPALERASLTVFTTDLLRIEVLDEPHIRVTSANSAVPGYWGGSRHDLVSLLTSDWLIQAVEFEESLDDGRSFEELASDLQFIRTQRRGSEDGGVPRGPEQNS